MKIDFTKATVQQLWTIISDDWYIPKNMLHDLVEEALRRNLFDYLIKHLINKMFNRWGNERRYNFYDLYSIGYVGITIALKNYQEGKGAFKTFAYMNIKSEFNHHIEKINSSKRKHYNNSVSLDIEKHDDNEESFVNSLIDYEQDPERAVIKKIFWDENLNKLSEREKHVLIYFANGYSMNEISRMYGLKGAASIHRQFHRGIKKINPNAGDVKVKELGLMTMSKGVVS